MLNYKPFVIRRSRRGKFQVHLYDSQGNQIAWSEEYNRKAGAKRCIYRTLHLDRNTPYSTILRLVKDRDTDGNPTYHFRIIGRNSEIVMHSKSVKFMFTGTLANQIIDICDSFDPDVHNGTEFYDDQSYIRKPKP